MSTRAVRITERDFRILQAMDENLKSFLKDAERKAAATDAMKTPAEKVLDVEVTVIIEKF